MYLRGQRKTASRIPLALGISFQLPARKNFPHFSVAAIDAQGWFLGLIGAREIVSVLLERFELDEAVPF